MRSKEMTDMISLLLAKARYEVRFVQRRGRFGRTAAVRNTILNLGTVVDVLNPEEANTLIEIVGYYFKYVEGMTEQIGIMFDHIKHKAYKITNGQPPETEEVEGDYPVVLFDHRGDGQARLCHSIHHAVNEVHKLCGDYTQTKLNASKVELFKATKLKVVVEVKPIVRSVTEVPHEENSLSSSSSSSNQMS